MLVLISFWLLIKIILEHPEARDFRINRLVLLRWGDTYVDNVYFGRNAPDVAKIAGK